jgi:hypothetical protein
MLQIENYRGHIIENLFIMEQRDHVPQTETHLAEEHISTSTQDQHAAFEKITSGIYTRSEETFFQCAAFLS